MQRRQPAEAGKGFRFRIDTPDQVMPTPRQDMQGLNAPVLQKFESAVHNRLLSLKRLRRVVPGIPGILEMDVLDVQVSQQPASVPQGAVQLIVGLQVVPELVGLQRLGRFATVRHRLRRQFFTAHQKATNSFTNVSVGIVFLNF